MSLELIFFSYTFLALALDDDDKPDLSPHEKKRRDRRTPRMALRRYSKSPFLYLLESGNEQALMNCCAVDYRVFQDLLNVFQPVFDRWTIDQNTGRIRQLRLTHKGNPCGRPRDLTASGALGLILYWYRTQGACNRSLPMAFGLTASPLYKWLKLSRRVLLYVLQYRPRARVDEPTEQEIKMYYQAIGRRYPILRPYKAWAAIDGLKLRVKAAVSFETQSMYYNGYTHGHYVNSVFLFAPDGRIRMCTINCPGSLHDSTIANYGGLYERMESIYEHVGARVVVDSAFKMRNEQYMIKSAQELSVDATEHEFLVNRAATSVRQLAEHGMRMIQGSFPRLRDNLPLDQFGERKVILHLMVLLYNYVTANVGINIILNTFMSKTDGFDSKANAYRRGTPVLIPENANDMFAF